VRSRSLLLVGFLVLLLPNLLFAQTNAGSLSGRVEDGTGAALPGVTVTASNAGTGFNRTVVTETDGTYRFPSLPVGVYEVTADLAGFGSVTTRNVEVNVSTDRALNITLKQAAVKERELREAEARAKQQTNITESELSIVVQANNGKADLARAQQEATKIQTLATAEAQRIRLMGEGEAKKIEALASAEAQRAARVGVAQAMAIDEQVRAYGGPRFQLTQLVLNRFSEAIQASGVDVVPRIMISGSSTNGGSPATGNVMEALLAMLLSEKIGAETSAAVPPRSAEAEAIRQRIRDGMQS